MNREMDPKEAEYSYINDGYIDIVNQSGNYEHLRKDRGEYVNPARHAQTDIRPVTRGSSTNKTNQAGCKCPRWWVWLLIVLSLVIIAGLAAVLVLQVWPKQDSQIGPIPTTTSSTTTDSKRTSQRTSKATLTTSSPSIPTDCQALYNAGHITSGVYTISPDGVRRMTVYCEQDLDGGGWTVFQQRQSGNEDFFRIWNDYKVGFGDPNDEFWLGNDNIHALTAGRGQRLKIYMTHPNTTQFHVSSSAFWIEDEDKRYKLHVSGFQSPYPLDDCMNFHAMKHFSTKDRDTEMQDVRPCAKTFFGGWWYQSPYCYCANLNGLYGGTAWTGIFWYGLTEPDESLTSVRMMVKTL